VSADGAFACVDVADEHNIHVLLDSGRNSGGICKVSKHNNTNNQLPQPFSSPTYNSHLLIFVQA
jgi:hypothetical protein